MYLSTAYFPPIQYFCKLLQTDVSWIEAQENFLKQSYRNRCIVMGSNGKLVLTVPVKRANSSIPITKIEIDYTEDWQRQHLRTLKACYGSSPFFEFYMPEFQSIFQERIPTLWLLNNTILKICCELLEITCKTKFTTVYKTEVPDDFRLQIHPKRKYQQVDETFAPSTYWQPFTNTYNFQENLSILDLLFNMGTESEIYLLNSIR